MENTAKTLPIVLEFFSDPRYSVYTAKGRMTKHLLVGLPEGPGQLQNR